ncbi:MAG: hypothetical protein WBQ23_08140 [Bacteroidota bacterium]
MKYNILAIIVLFLLVSACSGTKEEVAIQPPPVEKKVVPEKAPPEREFTYTERYYVKNAVIGDPADVSDPLQAIRVIQLKPGSGEVLVISSFDDKGEKPLETWLGIELPSFAPGKYNLSQAKKISFYRFYLGDDRKRIDGQTSDGYLKVESNENGELIGSIDATINGVTKSFNEQNQPVRVVFTGSFRIQEVELENTMMKTR